MTQGSTVVGVFTDRVHAYRAIEELHRASFEEPQIGFIARDSDQRLLERMREEVRIESTRAGLVSGGVLGGMLGAAVALLIPGIGTTLIGGMLIGTVSGAAVGVTAGELISSITASEITKEAIHFYQGQLATGRTLVAVEAGQRAMEAHDILRRYGSYDDREPAPHPSSMQELTTGHPAQFQRDGDGLHDIPGRPNIPFGTTG